MTVEWSEKRWPGIIHMLLRLFHAKAADQGALRIRLEEPAALGRMILEDREGGVLYALIDSSRTRDKWFYLPADTAEAGMALKNEAGETLFRLWVEGRNAVQPIQPMTETETQMMCILLTNVPQPHLGLISRATVMMHSGISTVKWQS